MLNNLRKFTVFLMVQIKQRRALTLDKVREMRMVSSSAVD